MKRFAAENYGGGGTIIKSIESNIEGLRILRPEIHSDQRGWLLEIYREDQIDRQFFPAMAYLSLTHRATSRGPHEHTQQSDLICFAGPSTFRIKLWDNRPASASFGKTMLIEGGEDNPVLLIIPPGVVHAYKNIGDCDGLVLNAPNRLYRGAGKLGEVDEIRYEDRDNTKFILDF